MLVKLYENRPSEKVLNKVVDVLKQGGVAIYPTDTVYALGCDILNPKALQKMARIKGCKLDKANFSIICSSISQLSEYVRLNNDAFGLLKRNLPGAFTFLLPANRAMQKKLSTNRKTVGVRIPDNPIILAIVEALGNPIVTTSIKDEDDIVEYITDPELIYEKYSDKVSVVVDGGYGKNIASTIVDCTGDEIEIVRVGEEILR